MWPSAEPDLFDRDDAVRTDPVRLEQLWTDPSRRVMAVYKAHIAIDPDESFALDDAILLGVAGGEPWFAVPGKIDGMQDLRAVAGSLTPVERSAALTAVALDNWHATHRRCPRCGEPTVPIRAGWVRQCPQDGSEHFPRTDPAVITLVVDDDGRALLGRRAIWPEGWFSTLAGFVEPGENFEQAVAREVAEEAGVQVVPAEVRYRGTQPWPFPCSIMIAFTAHVRPQPTEPDGEEIAETAWFSRDEFRAAAEAGQLRIPPPVSVAYHLIADWYGEAVPHTWTR